MIVVKVGLTDVNNARQDRPVKLSQKEIQSTCSARAGLEAELELKIKRLELSQMYMSRARSTRHLFFFHFLDGGI